MAQRPLHRSLFKIPGSQSGFGVNAGHAPLIGECIALPLLREAGSQRPGDVVYDEILYPIANRLLTRCDAVLRLPGSSKGADEDVRLAKERGLPVYHSLDEVPGCNPAA